jgi:hypothetical protein
MIELSEVGEGAAQRKGQVYVNVKWYFVEALSALVDRAVKGLDCLRADPRECGQYLQ